MSSLASSHQPILPVERGLVGHGAQLIAQLLDFGVDLVDFGARAERGEQFIADVPDDVDRLVEAGIGDVHGCGPESERVFGGRQRLVVGLHLGRDGPVCGVVARSLDAIARRDLLLRIEHLGALRTQDIDSRNRAGVGVDTCHGNFRTQYMDDTNAWPRSSNTLELVMNS
nr:hypothetical protein [Rhizobium sp. G21]